MSKFSFQQVDVFTNQPLKGNPLAVVGRADGLSDRTMALLGNWTNLSETAFLLTPGAPTADYRVRIFTPERELPFAGHPTLGSCQVWLNNGGAPKRSYIVQECAAGLIKIKRDGNRLAFAAPPLRRTGQVEPDLLAKIAHGLRIKSEAIKASQWVDNGPGWVAVMLGDRAEVLALKPDYPGLLGVNLGVIGPWTTADGEGADFEVRAFIPSRASEDPVTGSLNAGLAQWLIGGGLAPNTYVASQGTALGRAGRVHVELGGDDIWIGGSTVTVVEGTIELTDLA
jgi:PhzF family phenazine biosynthesis protein